jgi:hypothetical protein
MLCVMWVTTLVGKNCHYWFSKNRIQIQTAFWNWKQLSFFCKQLDPRIRFRIQLMCGIGTGTKDTFLDNFSPKP